MTYGVYAYGTESYAGSPSSTTGALPSMAVEIAFTTAPGATVPAWIDVTPDVRNVTIRRGRQRELDRYTAGHCTVVLDNSLRYYDPTYTSSPYNGYVIPMRRMRVRATYGGTTYPLFDGYIDGWDQNYDPPRDATATVDATDAFKVLTNVDLPISVYALEVAADAPTYWLRLSEPSASTVAYNVGSVGGTAAYQGGVTLGATGAITNDSSTAATFDGVDDCVSLGSAAVTSSLPYTIECWLKITTRSTTGDYFFLAQQRDNNSSTFGNPFGKVAGTDLGAPGKVRMDNLISTSRIDDNAWHHVAITADSASNQTLYIDGTAEATGTATTPAAGPTPEMLLAHPARAGIVAVSREFWPGSIDEFAIYNTCLSATRIAAHNTAGRTPWTGDAPGTRIGRVLDWMGWPTAQRQIDTGNSVLQSATLNSSVLEHTQDVQASEFGELFMTADGLVRFISRDHLVNATSLATFGDNTGELGYGDITYDYDDQLIRNSVTVSRNNGLAQTVEDSTSIAAYLRHSFTIDGLIHNDDGLSKDAATFFVSEYKDPILRVTGLAILPQRSPTSLFPIVLAAELGNKITVKRRPQAIGSAISQDCVIEGINRRMTPETWQTTWNLSPAYAGEFLELDATTGSGLDTARLYF